MFHGSCKSGDIVYLCDSGICICVSAAFPPPGILEGGLASQTQSFLFSVSRGSGTGENLSRRPEGGGQGSALASAAGEDCVPAKVRCPRRSPRGLRKDAWPSKGGWRVRALDRVQPPGTWGQLRGSWRHRPAGAAPGQSGGAGGGGGGRFWSSVLFQPQHSCPRLSHGAPPTLHFRPVLGAQPGIPHSHVPEAASQIRTLG